jgi:hypothetical protein
MEPWEVSAYRRKILERNGSYEENAGMDLECLEGVLEGVEERAGLGGGLGGLVGVGRDRGHKFEDVCGRGSSQVYRDHREGGWGGLRREKVGGLRARRRGMKIGSGSAREGSRIRG